MSQVAKLVVAKSVLKWHQSTRKLAWKLNGRQHQASKTDVNRYMLQWRPLKSLKLRMQHKLTAAQKQKQLDLVKARINWSIDHRRRMIFIDESPFELFHPSNHPNDRIWAGNSPEVPITNNVKRPAKAMVWVMMSFCGLSHLHIVPAAKLWCQTSMFRKCWRGRQRQRWGDGRRMDRHQR